jgi:cation transport regulator ChaB
MTIVATSIPVLRVFFKQAVNSAIETYHNSSSRSKSRNNPSSAPSTANVSLQRSSKRRTGTANNYSGGSFSDVIGKGGKSYLELEDLVIDEETGRVTALTPEALPDGRECHTPHQPL